MGLENAIRLCEVAKTGTFEDVKVAFEACSAKERKGVQNALIHAVRAKDWVSDAQVTSNDFDFASGGMPR